MSPPISYICMSPKCLKGDNPWSNSNPNCYLSSRTSTRFNWPLCLNGFSLSIPRWESFWFESWVLASISKWLSAFVVDRRILSFVSDASFASFALLSRRWFHKRSDIKVMRTRCKVMRAVSSQTTLFIHFSWRCRLSETDPSITNHQKANFATNQIHFCFSRDKKKNGSLRRDFVC